MSSYRDARIRGGGDEKGLGGVACNSLAAKMIGKAKWEGCKLRKRLFKNDE